MKLTRNFDSTETGCRCGCGGNVTMDFIHKLQELRDTLGFTLLITSGYRCATYNKKIGGALDSRHIYGDAADISTLGLTGMQKIDLIKVARSLGFTGFGMHPAFQHLDTRPGAIAVWFYPDGKISGGIK